MFQLSLIGIGLSLALVVYLIGSASAEKALMRESLNQLNDYEIENVRDKQLLNPFRDRTIKPILAAVTSVGRRFTPVGYVEQVRKKFLNMGNASPEAIDRFLAIRTATFVAAPVFGIWAWFFSGQTGMMRLALTGLGVTLFIKGPDLVVDRRVEERQAIISRALPDVLDLLTISVEAGLGFEQAVDRLVANVPGPLTQEFNRMIGEVRAGSSRADSMRAMEQRVNLPDVRAFVMAILQADTFGVSIGRILRSQADEMRIKRRQLAQERAMKAPVKMLLPMVFCIFPTLFIVTLAPAIINMGKSGF
jgi:tight adherence protein C